MTMRAIWDGAVPAESDDKVVVEGNHHFPVPSLCEEDLIPSSYRTRCPWKEAASYRSASVSGQLDPAAAWEYENPSVLARKVKGRVAFWGGVGVVAADATHQRAAG